MKKLFVLLCFFVYTSQCLAQLAGEVYYMNGVECDNKKDFAKALKWYIKGAKEGHAGCQRKIGFHYMVGDGVKVDYKEGKKWLEKAAKQEDLVAYLQLSYIYGYGVETPVDTNKALYLLAKCVDNNMDTALKEYVKLKNLASNQSANDYLYMALEYLSDKKNDLAASKLQSAVNEGDATSMSVLGILYENGNGVDVNFKKAVELYRQSAEKGCEIGMNLLGRCYEQGIGVPQSIDEAINWYQKAAENGYPTAFESISSLRKEQANMIKEKHVNNTKDEFSITDELEKDIPQTSDINNYTFAVIIANEKYTEAPCVPCAINDGKLLYTYCMQTLGIPKENIHFVKDATLNVMRKHVNWLRDVIESYKGEAKVIFYFTGHGIPNESNRKTFLLPIDGDATDSSSGYEVEQLYKNLSIYPAKSTVILFDASFSGTNRDGGMLTAARGVALKAKHEKPVADMVVFSATSESQICYTNDTHNHGLFTYYLLRSIKDSKGDITLGELTNFVTENVAKSSMTKKVGQTPIIVSCNDDWKNWKLK